MTRLEQDVDFELSNDPLHPWEAWVDGKHWQVSVTALPDGTRRYALLVDGRHEEDFTEWPPAWSRPPLPVAVGEASPASPSGSGKPPHLTDQEWGDYLTHMDEVELERRRFEAAKRIEPWNLDDYYDLPDEDDDEDDDD